MFKAIAAKDILCAFLSDPQNQMMPFGSFVGCAIKEAEFLIEGLKNGQNK